MIPTPTGSGFNRTKGTIWSRNNLFQNFHEKRVKKATLSVGSSIVRTGFTAMEFLIYKQHDVPRLFFTTDKFLRDGHRGTIADVILFVFECNLIAVVGGRGRQFDHSSVETGRLWVKCKDLNVVT